MKPEARHAALGGRVARLPLQGMAGAGPCGWRTLVLAALLALMGPSLRGQHPDTSLLERHFQEGQKALAEGRYAEAANAFEKLRKLAPEAAEVHAALGMSYFQQGKFSETVAVLRQALKLNPKLGNIDILLAMSLSELGKYEQALPGLENGFRNSSDAALKRSAGLRLQRAYTGLQRDREALEVTLELSRLYPEDPEVLYHTGRVSANFAYLTMRKLSDTAPDSVWMHQTAGEAFESQGQHEIAIAEYRKVLSLDPGRLGIHFRLGRSLLSLPRQPNSKAEALREFELELQLDPTNANAAYEAAEIRRKLEEFPQARQLFEMAVRYYPDFEEARVGLAKVLISLGKPDEALPHLEKALSLNPRSEVAHYRLSQVHKALGNAVGQRKALAEFQRLRSQKSRQQDSPRENFFPSEVTKQELDSEVAP